ncbi:unnamed protein product [Citrullus colocynthis]|uniref:Uncharacterized protein n=1 Tax=Citrullus colocynthis TaxID=252529 RepID=A0ABP0Y883_9ROSI
MALISNGAVLKNGPKADASDWLLFHVLRRFKQYKQDLGYLPRSFSPLIVLRSPVEISCRRLLLAKLAEKGIGIFF